MTLVTMTVTSLLLKTSAVSELGQLHRGQQLKKSSRCLSEVCDLVLKSFQHLVETILQQITARFESFQTDSVLAAFKVVFAKDMAKIWFQSTSRFGDVQIEYLSQHFSDPLMKLFSPTLQVGVGRVKAVCKDYIKQNENDDFITRWQSILECNDAADMNVLALGPMMMVLPMHTADIERNFSLTSRIKSD